MRHLDARRYLSPVSTLARLALVLLCAGAQAAGAQVVDSSRVSDTPALEEAADSLTLVPPDTLPGRLPLPAQALEHLAAISTTFFDTPDGMGLLPAGMAEAAVAAEYVRVAGLDSTNVRAMSGNMVHVLHAIDPGLTGGGYGLGYGFRRAAEGVRVSIQLAVQVEGVTEPLLYHAPFIEAAATGALAKADDVVALARQIQGSTDAAATHRLVRRLAALVRAMAYGADLDGDGRIGNDPSEAGLAQAGYHLQLVRRMEELVPAAAGTDSIGGPGR